MMLLKLYFTYVCLFIHGILCKVVFPKDGFKFNCGSNMCNYPLMYCDVVNGVCKYCSKHLCNTRDMLYTSLVTRTKFHSMFRWE